MDPVAISGGNQLRKGPMEDFPGSFDKTGVLKGGKAKSVRIHLSMGWSLEQVLQLFFSSKYFCVCGSLMHTVMLDNRSALLKGTSEGEKLVAKVTAEHFLSALLQFVNSRGKKKRKKKFYLHRQKSKALAGAG